MTTMVGIREIARNSNILDGYDYVEVEDKKTHEYKGLFISPKYAAEFKAFLEEKITKEHQEKLDRVMKFVGNNKVDERFDGLTSSEIKKQKAQEQYGK
jgi:hypothetical protein